MKKTFPDDAPSAASHLNLLVVALLLTLAFGLAAYWNRGWRRIPGTHGFGRSDGRVLGDSRVMFANSFFVKADAYFHSGYYPTIYDNNAPFKTPHIGEDSDTMESKNSGDEDNFLGTPTTGSSVSTGIFSRPSTRIWTKAARTVKKARRR